MNKKIWLSLVTTCSLIFSAIGFTPANATTTIIDTTDGSTIVGNFTFSLTIPQLDSFGYVHIEIVDVFGNPTHGLALNVKVTSAGTHTFTIDPFAEYTDVLTDLPVGSNGSNATGNPANSKLLPGVNQIWVDYSDSSTYQSGVIQPLLTNVIFKHACSPGTYSSDGGVPLQVGGACTPAPAGTYVATSGATSATNCPTGYTSPAGSTSSSACVAPAVTTTPVAEVALVASKACGAKKGKLVKKACLFDATGTAQIKRSSFTLSVAKSHRKICRVSGTSVKGLKVGQCQVTVKVKPRKGAATVKTTVLTFN